MVTIDRWLYDYHRGGYHANGFKAKKRTIMNYIGNFQFTRNRVRIGNNWFNAHNENGRLIFPVAILYPKSIIKNTTLVKFIEVERKNGWSIPNNEIVTFKRKDVKLNLIAEAVGFRH